MRPTPRPNARLGRPERLVFTLILILAGCQTPAARIEHFAATRHFQREIVKGDPFRHVVFRNQESLASSLHVYIEGDGTPFLSPTNLAADPTTRNALMLRLMALDAHRSVYLGRPCYLGLHSDAACSPAYWSLRRFSPEVVKSMAAVINTEMRLAGATRLSLFSHSGGAALAVLLTRELKIQNLITIGGNLDTARWTALHGYTALKGSLAPIDIRLEPELAERTTHFVGSMDTNVPATLVRSAAGRIGGTVREIPGYTHQCCWQQLWSQTLSDLRPD